MNHRLGEASPWPGPPLEPEAPPQSPESLPPAATCPPSQSRVAQAPPAPKRQGTHTHSEHQTGCPISPAALGGWAAPQHQTTGWRRAALPFPPALENWVVRPQPPQVLAALAPAPAQQASRKRSSPLAWTGANYQQQKEGALGGAWTGPRRALCGGTASPGYCTHRPWIGLAPTSNRWILFYPSPLD